MNDFRELALGVLASGIAFCCGLSFKRTISWWRARKIRDFWGPGLRHAPVVLFLGTFDGVPNVAITNYEPTGVAGLGDTHAVHEITAFLKDSNIDVAMSYTNAAPAQRTRQNLILLGATDVNPLMRLAAQELTLTLEYRLDSPITLYDHVTGRTYRAEFENDQIARDYGIIVRCRNPFGADRTLLIIAGIYGYGTWGGVRLLIDEHFRNDPRCTSHFEFECLYQVSVVENEPEIVKVLDIRPLRAKDVSGHPGT